MGQRIAVQQQERRSVASVPQMDSRAARHDLRPGEPFEHLLPPPHPCRKHLVLPSQAFRKVNSQRHRGKGRVLGDRRFVVELIKPSHYDDDGYVIQWWKSWIPSNSLACLYGIAMDLAERRALGAEVAMEIHAYDECHTAIPIRRIIRRI